MGAEHAHLRDSIFRITGMKIEDDKLYLIETRLSDVMKAYSLTSYDEVAQRLNENSDNLFTSRVIEKITTHETRFFRDESVFDALVMQILPEWMEKRGINRRAIPPGAKLEIWSCGCSTGQEPYSISMMLNEKMPEIARITTILGTDISQETIERAQSAVYSKFEVERGVPEVLLDRYFDKKDANSFAVKEQVKKMANFKVHNLVRDPISGSFDIIFFRNVAIYFEESQRKLLYESMKNHVKKDGVLVLGSAESLSGYVKDYIIREYGLARYYEVNASLVTIFK